jgi:hypothetical protein
VTRQGNRRVSGWVVAIGIVGTVLLAAGAFSLSFTSLIHFAVRFGINEAQAWEWPLIVDGIIIVATVSVVALAGKRGTGYAWALLAGGALMSVASNAAQAWRLDTESPLIAAAVATVPPVVLLAATHMTVILTRPDEPAIEPETVLPPPAAQPVPEPPPDPEPAPPPTGRRPPVQPALVSQEAVGDGERTWLMDKARRMRADGWSVAEIADDLGRSVGTIRRWLKTTETTETSGDDDE